MKLPDHVEVIRKLIDTAFRNRLGRMGITSNELIPVDSIPSEFLADRKRIETIREVLIAETKNNIPEAYEKLIEEFTFTLFNRLAALKVMEAHTLHPEVVTRRSQHGDRSFAQKHWLEQNPDGRHEDMEGMIRFMEDQLEAMATEIPLFNPKHPYHLLPTAIELNGIINAFNQVESDPQIENDIWQSDDILGWLYESYNNYKKAAHKESGDKTEYNKVSIQSQVYTPRWVVKFLVDNSLGKLYLEMYPDSDIKYKYKIANAPKTQTRTPKKLTELKLIDPATGSGNFLLYAFDLFYDLYTDQIENYEADYNENKIAELIITHNLHGVDLDDRAIQLAQLGLYIKAKRKSRSAKIVHFNVVSSDFYLPPYADVQQIFEANVDLDAKQKEIIRDIWADLQQAYKFGSLIRLEEKLSIRLHGLTQGGVTLFSEYEVSNYEQFRDNFFANLQKAVALNTAKQGQSFLNTKTQDAISFLQLITQKYDVAVANPPYTDSSDYGAELKSFIDLNYKSPKKFNANLFSTFQKRCFELVDNNFGKVGMLHPLTFMYISSFKDVRKYVLETSHINILAELGFGGVFANSDVQIDVVAYVLEMNCKDDNSIFLDFKKYKNHTNKPLIFLEAYENLINNVADGHSYILKQQKFKTIEGWPFIYWISDGFREKFKGKLVKDVISNCQGLATTNNVKYLRHWWESFEIYDNSSNKWYLYAKGGPYNKWYGNLWCIVNFEKNGYEIKEEVKIRYPYLKGKTEFVVKNENFYFREGITYSAAGQKGASYRYLPLGCIFDVGGSGIFASKQYNNLNYILAFFNSNFINYILDCLNPTVNTQAGDIERVPFLIPDVNMESLISKLSFENVEIKKTLCKYRIVETNYEHNPLFSYSESTLRDRLISHLNYENTELTLLLINEAIINELIFKVYELNNQDQKQVEANIGLSVGNLAVYSSARNEFFSKIEIHNEVVLNHINKLPDGVFDETLIKEIKNNFNSLYQGNSNLEEFCIKFQINPINIWYWFKEARFLPDSVITEYIIEFFAGSFRTLLLEDEDGIIPLIGLPGEPRLLDRLEEHCLNNGFSSAQFMQLDSLITKPINQYIEQDFFRLFSDHIKLFKQMPSTPFIWHLSSGEHQGFEAYCIIYKWNRDSLYKLKSSYLSKRTESLQYRLQQIGDSTSAQAQTEKETIRLQLQEIEAFAVKIDELIAEGYDPKLDDGVGKNIAPLQNKGMLRADVLNKKQLDKYLNADW